MSLDQIGLRALLKSLIMTSFLGLIMTSFLFGSANRPPSTHPVSRPADPHTTRPGCCGIAEVDTSDRVFCTTSSGIPVTSVAYRSRGTVAGVMLIHHVGISELPLEQVIRLWSSHWSGSITKYASRSVHFSIQVAFKPWFGTSAGGGSQNYWAAPPQLRSLLHYRRSPSVLRVYLSGISASHVGQDKSSPRNHS